MKRVNTGATKTVNLKKRCVQFGFNNSDMETENLINETSIDELKTVIEIMRRQIDELVERVKTLEGSREYISYIS